MTEVDQLDVCLNTTRDFALAQIQEWVFDGLVEIPESTPEESLRWFCACRQASQLLEANKLKDWAGILIDGYKPMGLQAELESFWDFTEDDEELIDGWQKELLEELEQHFGIEKENAV